MLLNEERAVKPIRHLYVHIPFCPHICPYCSFHVLPVHKEHAEKLVDHLLAEYNSIARNLNLHTIFLGGGTPTALSIARLERLLSAMLQRVPRLVESRSGIQRPASRIEITSECNPSTLSSQKAERLLSLGVNRLSIGAQSFDPAVLKTLGRTHSAAAIVQCVETARRAGFININLDLIFGVPGQTLVSWKSTLETALSLQPRHISCYGLTYEEDTDFFVRRQRGELKSNDPLESAMFDLADQMLTRAGFGHYEISNYALPEFECRHNLAYWQGEDYYGIGPSAVSTVNGVRWRNSKFKDGCWKAEEEERLSPETLASERMALGLRIAEGIKEVSFAAKFGFLPRERWRNEIDTLIQNQLLIASPALQLTRRGREVADEVAICFMQ